MHTFNLDTLNDRFAIADHLSFQTGPGNLPVAEIRNAHASATVALLGGHVIAFQPLRHEPVLWLSRYSHFEVGRPIRGGIPVCWPWFAAHPDDPAKPMHGFVRTALWTVMGTNVVADEATQIQLGITDSETTRVLWPYTFDLQIVVTVGTELRVELFVHNPNKEALVCTGALHSYFSISSVSNIAIHGLDGCSYLDKVGVSERKVQKGPVTISSETDRIYLDTTAECIIEDPGLNRRIRIAKAGSHSTVVWNPWIDKAKRMEDFGDKEYPGMVCVETTNAAEDAVTVPPAGEHLLGAVISVRKTL